MNDSQSASTPPPLRLGLSSGALYPLPTEDVPDAAARLGFDEIEVMLQTPGEYEPAFGRLLAGRARDAGVRIQSVHLWHEAHRLFTAYPRRTAEGLARFEQGVALAAELGAAVIVWHGAARQETATPAAWERFVDVVLACGATSAAAGVLLTIENVSWCALATVREVTALAAALADRDPARMVGFTFDPFQAVEADANPFMLLAAMGDRVANVHLSDRSVEAPGARHLSPGEGDLPWPALLRALHGAYRGPLMLEGSVGADEARIVTSRHVLQPLLDRVLATTDDPCAGIPPPGVQEGIRLFNQREFFACHEVIEHEWHAERRPIRRLYQGILQIGVGFHHALNGNHRGALLLLRDGIEKTTDFLPFCLGIETDLLVAQSQRCLDTLVALGPAHLADWDTTTIPRIMPFAAEDPADPAVASMASPVPPAPIPITRQRA